MSHMISLLTCYVITLLNSPEICHLNLIVTTLLFKLKSMTHSYTTYGHPGRMEIK